MKPLHGTRPALLALFAAVACVGSGPARAADTPSPPPPPAAAATPLAPADPLAASRALIKQSRWADAIAELQRANRNQNADWHNLMGYSFRKASQPDLVRAQQHYDHALRIDPKHRGALEYSGELFLMKGDVASARQRLSTLEAVCGRCEEQEDLKNAIAKFDAAKK